MGEANLPEEIIVNIISRLPVKSLVQFTSVSKRWHSIILFDPHFTTQLRRNKTLTRRLLPYSRNGNPGKLKSLDSETKSVKKVNFPFKRRFVTLLGSCDGLVFVVDENHAKSFRVHVWNPLTGFVKELPNPGFSTDFDLDLRAYGVGYLPATNEYKVILSYAPVEDDETWDEGEEEELWFSKIMSLKDGIWRSIEAPRYCYMGHQQGTLVNESLHWLKTSLRYEIVAFDLAREEFREIGMPDFGPKRIRDLSELKYNFGGCLGRCLCVLRYPPMDVCDSIEFWVMREYGVSESWTKLFTLRFSNPQRRWSTMPLFDYGKLYSCLEI
ncbi:PREDICTED: F-box/kelch-repeat protein At3g06240-like [Fragaria vesca subsp. vesca]